jgi:hypothetical protein
MHIGWKNIIPITFGWFIFIILFKYITINYINYIDYLNFVNVYDRI